MVPTLANRMISAKPLSGFLSGIMGKLVLSFSSIFIVQYLSTFVMDPWHARVIMIVTLLLSEGISTLVFSSIMGFFSKVSDPAIGGTSMTLFNTAMNLGSKWTGVLSLFLIPKLTFAHCVINTNASFVRIEAACVESEECANIGGTCITDYDGYVLLAILCSIVGVFWIIMLRPLIMRLEQIPQLEWRISKYGNTHLH
jgi:PAT family acetyl-CoA transporter-like MFS transporter 1